MGLSSVYKSLILKKQCHGAIKFHKFGKAFVNLLHLPQIANSKFLQCSNIKILIFLTNLFNF